MKKVKSTSAKTLKPKKDRELPVTKRWIDLRLQEVKGDVTSLRLEMRTGFKKVDAKFLEIDARFESVDNKLTKMMILLEDQNDRNRAVLDAYTKIYEKLIEREVISPD